MQKELSSRKYFTPEKHPEFYQHKDGSIAYRQLSIPIEVLDEENVDGFLDVNNPNWNTLSRTQRLETLRSLYDEIGFSKLFMECQVFPTIRKARVPRLSLSASLNIASSSVYGRTNLFCENPYLRVLVTGNLKEDEPVMNPRSGDIDGEIGLIDTLGGHIDAYIVIGHAKDARFFEIKDYEAIRKRLNHLSSIKNKDRQYQENLSEVILSDNISLFVSEGIITEHKYLPQLNLIGFSAWDTNGEIEFVSRCMNSELRERLLGSGIVNKVIDEIDCVELPESITNPHARQALEILYCSVIKPSLIEDANLPSELQTKVDSLREGLERLL